jgi:hypothetical protein
MHFIIYLSTALVDKSLLVKSKFVDLEFVVPEVLIAIVQDYPIRRDIVLLKATGLKFTFVKRSFDMQVVAKLRSLLVEDKLQTYGTDFQYLATSTRSDSSIDNDLVVIEYTNIQRVSQDFVILTVSGCPSLCKC